MADPKYQNDWTTKYDLIEHELMGVIFEQIDAGYEHNDATVAKLLNGNPTTPAEIIKLCELIAPSLAARLKEAQS